MDSAYVVNQAPIPPMLRNVVNGSSAPASETLNTSARESYCS